MTVLFAKQSCWKIGDEKNRWKRWIPMWREEPHGKVLRWYCENQWRLLRVLEIDRLSRSHAGIFQRLWRKNGSKGAGKERGLLQERKDVVSCGMQLSSSRSNVVGKCDANVKRCCFRCQRFWCQRKDRHRLQYRMGRFCAPPRVWVCPFLLVWWLPLLRRFFFRPRPCGFWW